MTLLSFILALVSFLWSLYLTYLFLKKSHQDQTPSSLSADHIHTLTTLESGLNQLADLQSKNIQKIKLVRFNPFQELGGQQSFILALLDNHNNGVIITSLHTKDTTRLYAKPVKNGAGDQVALSKEEKAVVDNLVKI